MLEIRNIDAYYGKVQVLSNVSLEVGKDEIISLIGANGAGKSTLMKTVMGLLRPKKGSVIFQGEDITKIKNTKNAARNGVHYYFDQEVTAIDRREESYCVHTGVAFQVGHQLCGSLCLQDIPDAGIRRVYSQEGEGRV